MNYVGLKSGNGRRHLPNRGEITAGIDFARRDPGLEYSPIGKIPAEVVGHFFPAPMKNSENRDVS